MDPAWILAYVFLGAGTGLVAGLFGIGGGGIMVPALTLLFIGQGFDAQHLVHLALGTSLAAIVPTAFAGVRTHHQHNAILRSEEHTSELQSRGQLVCRLLLENKKNILS